jgi:hypothetical protein
MCNESKSTASSVYVLDSFDADPVPLIHRSGDSGAACAGQVQIRRERLALSEGDLEVTLLHGSTPYAVATTRRCSTSSGSTSTSLSPLKTSLAHEATVRDVVSKPCSTFEHLPELDLVEPAVLHPLLDMRPETG